MNRCSSKLPLTSISIAGVLCREKSGVAAIEFALLAPVIIVTMLGMSDLIYDQYVTSVVWGAVQKAGRDSTIEGNNSASNMAAIDGKVMATVRIVAPSASFTSTRMSYSDFANVDVPEPFTDTNGDGIRETGECYSDTNGNGRYDTNDGLSGQGGASDVAVYSITVTYPRLFPVQRLLGWSASNTITAQTALKNQPYNGQSVPIATTICT